MKFALSAIALSLGAASSVAPMAMTQSSNSSQVDVFPSNGQDAAQQRAERIQERLDATKERLNVTDEQAAQIEPILRASAERRRDLLAEFGSGKGEKPKLKFRQQRDLRKKLNGLNDATTQSLSGFLNAEKLAEYATMREKLQSR